MGVAFEIIQGDITDQPTDAIVNAANSQLKLGAGVAGAIRSKGGPDIQKECDEIGGCLLGSAVITTGGKLRAKYVIHAVGPRYGIDPEPDKNLKSAIKSSIEVAENKGLKSISIPAVSTGIYGYPLEDAAKVIISAILEKLDKLTNIRKIVLCLFSEKDYKIFTETMDRMK